MERTQRGNDKSEKGLRLVERNWKKKGLTQLIIKETFVGKRGKKQGGRELSEGENDSNPRKLRNSWINSSRGGGKRHLLLLGGTGPCAVVDG